MKLILILIPFLLIAKEIDMVNYSHSPWAIDDSLLNKKLIIEKIFEIYLDTTDIFADPLFINYPSSFNNKDMRVIVVCREDNDDNYYVFYVEPDKAGKEDIMVGDMITLANANLLWIGASISYLGDIPNYTNYNSIPEYLNGPHRTYSLAK